MNVAIIPLLSAIVSFGFALSVLDQFFARRKPYQLVWTLGLFMYFIATGAEFWMETTGINALAYRLWYLFGAILVAAYLGMGTLYLLTSRRTANILMAVLGVISIYALFRVFTAPLDLGQLTYLSGKAMPMSVRVMTPFLNLFGTLALAGGALFSAFVFWRRRFMPHRVTSNIFIALGAMLPAIGGTRMRLESPQLFYFLELLGVIIIFIGFLRSREVFGLYRFPLLHGLGRERDN
ncbi:MAG: hypothetical protein HYX85_01300 [Chloroflexi bacterium]|nr:hypothetical protein [Chloroflexota bacterium]